MARVGLGDVFNVVAAASSITIPLTRASTVSFVTFLDAGTQVATITELDSTGVNSEQALDVTNAPHKAPGVGGSWTAMAEQDDTLDLSTDATNDCMVFSVHASQLSDGYDSVECTLSSGIVMAVIHDLAEASEPASLASNIVA